MKEEWRPVIWYEHRYEVSNMGRVRSLKTGRILKPILHPRGYVKVYLRDCGKDRQVLIHSLVMEAFVGPRPEGITINHKNGVKDYNALPNLEYMTMRDNIDHATHVLRINVGENNKSCKIKDADIATIRHLRAKGETLTFIASKFNCSFQHISSICTGRSRALS